MLAHLKKNRRQSRFGIFARIPITAFYMKIGRNTHITVDEFIERAKEIHGNRYDYSLITEIPNNHTCVPIICKEHGVFMQRVDVHLRGFGCKLCSKTHKYTTEEWVKKAKEKRGEELFGYDKVNYINARTKVKILCKKHNEYFEIKPNDFLWGHGCPKCNYSHLENRLENALLENSIQFIPQYKEKWLNGMSFDFYIPNKNIAIECQGIQHFEEKEYFNKREHLEDRIKRDIKKKEICNKKSIKLIYFLDKKHEKYMKKDDEYFIDIDILIKYLKAGN